MSPHWENDKMKEYDVIFQGDEVIYTLKARSNSHARQVFNRQISIKRSNL